MRASRPSPASGHRRRSSRPTPGYIYSGPVAASAYARVAPLRGKISRVVLAGPAHRVHVRGAAAAAGRTPSRRRSAT